MKWTVQADGTVVLAELSMLVADTLIRVPELLESDDPRVRGRLLPATFDSDEDDAQWRRLVHPELEHLFASRAAIVREDLRSLGDPQPDDGLAIRIPTQHRSAWIAALNGASHALFQLHGLTPADVEREIGTLGRPEKDLALLRIHVIGAVVALLLDADGFGFPDRDTVDEWRDGPELE
ncbi:MAG: hypothetical protein IPM29_18740 [Planctomycetes bacterium]|nr:hypothetical protein [Planctomycetota bacterium]